MRSGGSGHEIELCKQARFLLNFLADSWRADPNRRTASIIWFFSGSEEVESRSRSRDRSREDARKGSESPRIVLRRASMFITVGFRVSGGAWIPLQGRFGKRTVSMLSWAVGEAANGWRRRRRKDEEEWE